MSQETSPIYVLPCIDGNSSTGELFNFSVSVSRCTSTNCTAVNSHPGASIVSPILLCLAGIAGQVCALIYLHRGSRPSNHRTTFYVMLATLIWTDLIGKTITTPLPVLSYAWGHWAGGARTCNLHGYSMSLIGLVTHFLVALMALERYIGIRCGYFYNKNVTTSRSRRLLLIVWIFCLSFCSLPYFGIGKFKLHYPGTWCHIDHHVCADQPLPDRIFSNLYASINLFCFCIIVICNLVVVGTLLKMSVTTSRPSKSCPFTPKKSNERELQMVILLVIITITFICSWTAHDVLMIKNQIWPAPPNKNPMMDIQAIRLVALNQIIDPWSYIICRMIFRTKLWKLCRGVLIGKVMARRFSEQSEEISPCPSANGVRTAAIPKGETCKGASLPNPEVQHLAPSGAKDKLPSEQITFQEDLCRSDSGSRSNLRKGWHSYIATLINKLFDRSKEQSLFGSVLVDRLVQPNEELFQLNPTPTTAAQTFQDQISERDPTTSSHPQLPSPGPPSFHFQHLRHDGLSLLSIGCIETNFCAKDTFHESWEKRSENSDPPPQF